jgi:hypothetical protein
MAVVRMPSSRRQEIEPDPPVLNRFEQKRRRSRFDPSLCR